MQDKPKWEEEFDIKFPNAGISNMVIEKPKDIKEFIRSALEEQRKTYEAHQK